MVCCRIGAAICLYPPATPHAAFPSVSWIYERVVIVYSFLQCLLVFLKYALYYFFTIFLMLVQLNICPAELPKMYFTIGLRLHISKTREFTG